MAMMARNSAMGATIEERKYIVSLSMRHGPHHLCLGVLVLHRPKL